MNAIPPDIPPPLPWERPRRGALWVALGALAGGAVAGLAWSLIEATLTKGKAGTFVRIWAATGFAAGLAMAVVSLGALALYLAARSPRGGGRLWRAMAEDAGTRVGPLLAGALAILLGSLSFFGLVMAAHKLFAATAVRAIALAGLAPVVLGLGWLLTRALGAPIGRAIAALGPTRARLLGLTLAAAFVAGWVMAIVLLAPNVFKVLDLRWMIPLAGFGVAALVGARWLALPHRAIALGAPALAALAFLTAWHLSTDLPASARSAVKRRAFFSRLVVKTSVARVAKAGKTKTAGARGARPDGSCFPGVPGPDLSKLGKVKKGAPDIILLTVDAWRFDHTSLAGYKRKTTPKLKKHAKTGAVFTRAYSPSSSTRFSFRALFTGLLPSQIASPKGTKWGVSFVKGQETLASMLRAAGYHTIAVVSDRPAFPKKHKALHGFDELDYHVEKAHFKRDYSASFVVNRILGHVAAPPVKRKPRFIWSHLREPHRPYLRGPKPKRYGSGDLNKYDSAIYYVDHEMGRLLDALVGKDRQNDVVLVVTGDHGEAFKEHGTINHGWSVYEEEIHVPLVIWAPKTKPGEHDLPVNLNELAPTLLSLVGLEPPPALCGRDLTPLIRKGEALPRTPVLVQQMPDHAQKTFSLAFFDRDMKLIVNPSEGTMELYDLEKDPREKRDHSEKDPATLADMVARFTRYVRQRGMDPADYLEKPPAAEADDDAEGEAAEADDEAPPRPPLKARSRSRLHRLEREALLPLPKLRAPSLAPREPRGRVDDAAPARPPRPRAD
jgi:arylsulfatase A-like enzyme